MPIASCFTLDRQLARFAFSLALARAGNNMPARMAMMAITTSSSIKVKARWMLGWNWVVCIRILSEHIGQDGEKNHQPWGEMLVNGGRTPKNNARDARAAVGGSCGPS